MNDVTDTIFNQLMTDQDQAHCSLTTLRFSLFLASPMQEDINHRCREMSVTDFSLAQTHL